MQSEFTCPACGSEQGVMLPLPHDYQSMLSDGRILNRPISKIHCSTCGLISHYCLLSSDEVTALYKHDNYFLPSLSRQGDEQRAKQYLSAISSQFPDIKFSGNILDVGCGSGALLAELAKKDKNIWCVGLDPALPEYPEFTDIENDRIDLHRNVLSKMALESAFFDNVISINTIEHVNDPIDFLSNIAKVMKQDGYAIIICPADSPANVELLFFDHLWTFTNSAMGSFGKKAGLKLSKVVSLERPLSGFKAYLFRHDNGQMSDVHFYFPSHEDAAKYLMKWRSLESTLFESNDLEAGKIQIFGAGQMAALLRAYAPKLFSTAERLVVDEPHLAWPLGNIEKYNPGSGQDGWLSLLAVHPAVRDMVFKRIVNDGGQPVSLPIGDH